MMRRVVITGLGMVSPLGDGVDPSWSRILLGHSGIRAINRFDVSDLPARIAGMIPFSSEKELLNDNSISYFDATAYLSSKDQRKVDQFILYAIAAAEQAVKDANLVVESSDHAEQIGVLIGSGIGGLPCIYDTTLSLEKHGPRRVSPFFIPASLINLASGHVSIRHGFKGPNLSVVTACATGAHAIGDAMRLIQFGDAEVMVAGGTEAALCRPGLVGFSAARALSTNFNDTPHHASRPWDKDRDGFVMGEGAGIVVLESLEHAINRGARIYAEVVGYGLSGDAHHITAPSEEGDGAFRAMRGAIKSANISVSEVDYINAHGTSTPSGDLSEIRAVKRLFGDHGYRVLMSSTKSAIGHLLGAAGSVESIFSILAIRDQIVPPTLNLDNPSDECDLNLVPHKAVPHSVRCVMSNSFGFGGTNASLIFKAFNC